MIISKKKGGGDILQNFIKSGGGSHNGEYYGDISNESFECKYMCSKEELVKLLGKEIVISIITYSMKKFGKRLNERIANNNLLISDFSLIRNIKKGIKLYSLPDDITVFRGISLSKEFYENSILKCCKKHLPFQDRLICSTSKNIMQAMKYSVSLNDQLPIRAIFIMSIKKSFHALPIESIANDQEEKEVLLWSPTYIINKIQNVCIDKECFKFISVTVEDNYD